METFLSYGVTYIVTNSTSIATLVAAIYGIFIKRSTRRLSVRAVLLCQSPQSTLTKSDINEFLCGVYREDSCDWLCTQSSVDRNYRGPAREAFHIDLEHESMLHEDSLRELPIRDICSKLVGVHTFKGRGFWIVPEQAAEDLDEVDRLFGTCLILMHLRELYKNVGDDERTPDKHISHVIQRFVDEFGMYAEYLSKENVIDTLEVIQDAELEKMVKVLTKHMKRDRIKSRR
ncbi:hypothetical protein BDV28DRAFT_145242 [Aspergillus coremiiformis]|uniref:Uncharacterized protein n=1 Tax=Aspergillus coremiiformis TaxID=138285 RepID=A0A5N6ZFC1_9EURO|nr:hypothetical protein BDV28DRAFT_145242 [Aspergillus coremiiformis]